MAGRRVTPLSPATCSLDDAQRPLPMAWKAGLLAEILTAYARVRWLLLRSDLPRALEALRSPRQPAAEPDDPATPWAIGQRLGTVVSRILSALPSDSRCLMRSLVLTRLLAKRGIESTLIIGAQTDPEFRAHAWVEQAGTPVLSPGAQFNRLVEL